ncbi:hypothetical protein GQ43DRAFT_455067 [Delitschia confertaspora ATCC 74209]|uniref:F-box domain-containing protein n=1 Tax=Delitschia confertaspora ATCC 74209 TaxID=1513339 RepID=A0A9P4JQF2_9PLEO|nr:hypothetical protein GQ43DRAFT_455067 [Delitschia confertaspora ATCC 74209]
MYHAMDAAWPCITPPVNLPQEWHHTLFLTLLAVTLPLLFIILKGIKTKQTKTRRFQFLDLPPELRGMVYDFLLEDPRYPSKPILPKMTLPSVWRMLTRRPNPSSSTIVFPKEKKPSNWIFATNRQIHAEYMDYLCKRRKFQLTIAPENYPQYRKEIWAIGSSTLQHIRKCDINLIATSTMLGVKDPRDMVPGSWPLAAQIQNELSAAKEMTELSLHVRAIGNVFWNPLWLWYHATMALWGMGTAQSNAQAPHAESCNGDDAADEDQRIGSKFNKITFSLDTWSPGENFLQRDDQGRWGWYCPDKSHWISAGGDENLTIREFCAKIYYECMTCIREDNGLPIFV